MTYGNIPKIQLRIQENIVMANPSRRFTSSCPLTKIKGKQPTIAVIRPLSSSGEKDESKSLMADTPSEMNMNRALKSNAIPIYLAISFMFIYHVSW